MFLSMNWISDFVDFSGLDKLKLIHQFSLSTAEVEDPLLDDVLHIDCTEDGGIIAGIGILVLFWTVIRLATYVENSFNQIWAVRKGRTFFRKISDYLSVIIIAPILLVVMSSSTIFARKILSDVSQTVPDTFIRNSVETGLAVLPVIMAWLLFVFIYVFIPNTKVRLSSALFGGFFAAILYQAAQLAYINIQLKLSSYNSIYGSFSALPLFLIWSGKVWKSVGMN